IHVARIAGLPKPVVDRAWKVLERLESEPKLARGQASPDQLDLFGVTPLAAAEPEAPIESGPHPVLGALAGLRVDELTPLQALNELARLSERARSP
ncbi:MAG TPA: hypothetical protein VM598_12945, partial [Bdellovibrionota bacterium]|nr:hypothetical protein [Bdellovibrionota bacterium]